jgi:hypothetical protein
MSKPQTKRRNQAKLARLEIISKLYLRGYSIRQLNAEVIKRLNLESYSTRTTLNDIRTLLAEWKENRLENMDDAVQLELERIDETVRELWGQWEKSKEDYTATVNTRKGAPRRNEATGANEIKTYSVESRDSNVVGLGNPSYISEIRAQLAERRKLLGLYAPEKRQVEGRVDTAIELSKMSEDDIRAEIARITGSIENQ